MASNSAVRCMQRLTRRTKANCECATKTYTRTTSIRQLSTSAARQQQEHQTQQDERPRWSYTPEKMKAPFAWRIKDPNKKWEVNNDPEKLDRFYNNFLGRGGDSLLTEEVKWLAVTHKSFDQGRRGFNDRLAFMGRRILNLQTSLALLHSPTATATQKLLQDTSDTRKPFTHPALDRLLNISNVPMAEVLSKERIAGLATQVGMSEILRWVPRNPKRLRESGQEMVMTAAVYAIIGAISLQKGGDVAAEVAREKVLKPLGIS